MLMPKTRGGCAGVPRPCPFSRCRHSLVADNGDSGESCSLDVADRGPLPSHEIAPLLGLDRLRVDRVETEAMRAVSREFTRLRIFRDDIIDSLGGAPTSPLGGASAGDGSGAADEDDVSSEETEDQSFCELVNRAYDRRLAVRAR